MMPSEEELSSLPETSPIKTGLRTWEPLINAQQQNEPLDESHKRALKIREISLSIFEAIDQFLNDPTIKGDPVKEAEVTVDYWKSMLELQRLGVPIIKGDSDVSEQLTLADPVFNNPVLLAEWVGGQLLGVEAEKLPNVRQTIHQLEEHSQGEIKLGGESGFLIPLKNLPPILDEWLVMRGNIPVFRAYLASKLDSPQQSPDR